MSGHRTYNLVGAFTLDRLMLASPENKIAQRTRLLFEWCTRILVSTDQWWQVDVTGPVRFDVLVDDGVLQVRMVSVESARYFQFRNFCCRASTAWRIERARIRTCASSSLADPASSAAW